MKGVGTACNDNDDSTTNDVCDASGNCAGSNPCSGVTCDQPPNDQCYEASGSCSLGNCEYTKKTAGTSCDDSDECTSNDVCQSDGTCAGTTTRNQKLKMAIRAEGITTGNFNEVCEQFSGKVCGQVHNCACADCTSTAGTGTINAEINVPRELVAKSKIYTYEFHQTLTFTAPMAVTGVNVQSMNYFSVGAEKLCAASGAELSQQTAEDVMACAKVCEDTSTCAFFSWDDTAKNCVACASNGDESSSTYETYKIVRVQEYEALELSTEHRGTCGHSDFIVASSSECETYMTNLADGTVGRTTLGSLSTTNKPRGCCIHVTGRNVGNLPKMNTFTGEAESHVGRPIDNTPPVCRQIHYFKTALGEACPDWTQNIVTYKECQNAMAYFGDDQTSQFRALTSRDSSAGADDGKDDVGSMQSGWSARVTGCSIRADGEVAYYNSRAYGNINKQSHTYCYQGFVIPKYDYMPLNTDCPAGKFITSLEDCQTALPLVGVARGVKKETDKKNYPQGCSVQNGWRGWWNAHATGRPKGSFRSVCYL